MRISDWSSDVCSSDLLILVPEPWFKGARFAPRSSFAWSRPHEGDGRWELFHSRRRASWRSTESSRLATARARGLQLQHGRISTPPAENRPRSETTSSTAIPNVIPHAHTNRLHECRTTEKHP